MFRPALRQSHAGMTFDRRLLRDRIVDSMAAKQRFLDHCVDDVAALIDLAAGCLRSGGKIMLCGNGGSACDAAHVAAELVGWFENKSRGPLAAMALGHEVPMLTAIGNDAGYEHVFSRQVEALGRPGDLLIGISTSGGSKNVVAAMKVARVRGLRTAAFASTRGGPVVELAEVAIAVPSTSTPRIQECHLLAVHLLCEGLELTLA